MKKLLVTLILIALLTGAYLLGRSGDEKVQIRQEAIPAPQATAMTESQVIKFQKSTLNASRKFRNVPLPPANTPLSEIYYSLQKRADAGDAKAACRLAVELLRCEHFNARAKYLAIDTSDYAADERDSLNDKLSSENGQDEERVMILERSKSCNNISGAQLKNSFKYMRQGAYSGEPEALMAYINGMPLGGDFSAIRGRDFDVWRSDALPLAQNALSHGLPSSVLAFSNAYSLDTDWFSGLVENDPYQAEVMRQLYQRLFAITPSHVENELSNEQNRIAREESEKLFQQNFRGQTTSINVSANPMTYHLNPRNTDRAPCQ